MKTQWLLLFCLLFAALPVMAQDPPEQLMGELNDATGEVSLTWVGPFAADYEDDFEDGEAQGWIYDVDTQWGVEAGAMYGTITPVSQQWTGAAYATEMFTDNIQEVEVTRTAGTASFSQAIFMRASGPYGDVTGFNGYMVNIAPADFGGAFLVVEIINDVLTFITPSWTNFDMNIGVGATNTMSVQAIGTNFVFYINGMEAYTWTASGVAEGHPGVGFAEDLGIFGRVEWEYVAVDDLTAGPASIGGETIGTPGLPVVDDSYVLSAPARLNRVPEAKFESEGILYDAAGHYIGSNVGNELDDFIEWRVYRDGSQVGSTTDTFYDDMLPDFGTYDYTVTGFYDEGESDAAGPVTVTWQDPANFPISEDFDDGLPDSWSVEGTVATLNWHTDFGAERGLFPTPYMLIDSDAPGSCPHVIGRLIAPMVETSGAPAAMLLEYEDIFNEYIEEFGYTDWSSDGGATWMNINTLMDDQIDPTFHSFDVTDAVQGADNVWFSWQYDDNFNWGWYWAVDNVEVYLDDVAGPYSFNLMPTNTDIPVGGGTVVYDAFLTTNVGQSFQGVQYWSEVELPNGQMFGPLQTIPGLTIPPFADLSALNMSQNIPAGAPAGTYTFYGNIGYPGFYISDSFMFTKAGAAADNAGEYEFVPSEWTSSPMQFTAAGDEDAIALPEKFELGHAYPNPFNPTTTVNVALPEAAELTVSVFNVMGQQVAQIANGQYQAGNHALVFDASSLSSGIYFIQANIPGELSSVQKVTLMK